MKTIMIINEKTDRLESTYQVEPEKVNNEVSELKKKYDDVNIDNDGDVIVWK